MTDHQISRHVLITGGTGSVGRALVEAFSGNGDSVMFQYHGNRVIAEELQTRFGAEAIQVDFSRDFSLPRNDFDIVINNAGINITDSVTHEVTLDDWNRTLTLNITVPFLIAQLYLPSMMRKRWGRIINISSIYGLRAVEGNLPYTVSKHALSGLTKTIAKEYAAYGITCNEICPGPIDSDLIRRIGTREADTTGISLEDYLSGICKEIPAGRMAYPREIASLAMFIASLEAGYLTGASIPFDGGIIA